MSGLPGGGLVLRKCSVGGCTKLCVKASDCCRQHTDHPPLSKRPTLTPHTHLPHSYTFTPFIPILLGPLSAVFEAPDDPFESPPSSAKPPSFPSFSSSTPPLHPLSPPTPPALLTPHSSPFPTITCRDTLTTSHVINTADLIPYDIPIDHEDGRPPPTHNFLYDDPDSARNDDDSDAEDDQQRGATLSPVHAGLPMHALPGHGHAVHHHILVVDTKVDRGEEKDVFRASPGSRSASASFSSPSPSSSSLYMSPNSRRPSLSPRSPSTPRSVQALVDRITMLEQTNVQLIKETMELRRELDGSREKVREMGKKVAVLEERERGGSVVKERKAPIDLPPVTISPSIASPSATSASSSFTTSSSSSSHFSARLAAVTASSGSSAASSPSARGPQLAPLFTATRGSSNSTTSTSTTSPRHLTLAVSHLTTPAPFLSSPSSSSSSHADATREKSHSLSHDHPPPAPAKALFSYPSNAHSPSPSSSPLSSRPASASSPVTLSPVSSFYSQQPPSATSSPPPPPVKAQLMRGHLSRVKSSSSAANLDGSSMNVGNVMADKPSIRLFPHYAAAETMKTLLTDEGMGIRYEGERK